MYTVGGSMGAKLLTLVTVHLFCNCHRACCCFCNCSHFFSLTFSLSLFHTDKCVCQFLAEEVYQETAQEQGWSLYRTTHDVPGTNSATHTYTHSCTFTHSLVPAL